MRTKVAFHSVLGPLFALLLLAGCAPLIADYSLEAYKNATTLKAETQALIDKSNELYSIHAKEVDALTTKINAAYEFAAGTPYNQLSAQQWDILRDPKGQLYGAIIAGWKDRKRIPKAKAREENKLLIGKAFDEIICLEANKQTLKSCYITTTDEAAGKESKK